MIVKLVKAKLYLHLLIVLSAISYVHGFGTGAPDGAYVCETMIPGHGGIPSQQPPLPYDFLVSDTDLSDGSPLTVSLNVQDAEDSPESFKGFFLQARKTDGDITPQGTWVPDESLSHGLECEVGENSALTHNSKEEKTHLEVQWNPPGPGEYEIWLTVVQDYSTFWVAQKSAVVTVS